MARVSFTWAQHVIYVFLLLFVTVVSTYADVYVMLENSTIAEYLSMPSTFGKSIPDYGISGYLSIADPITACTNIKRPPNVSIDPPLFFALIKRGECDFDKKVFEAQCAGYDGAIVYNDINDGLLPMTAKKYGKDVYISSVFVGETSGLELKGFQYNPQEEYVITLTAGITLPWGYYLYPFITVITTCLIFSCFYGIAKFIRDRRRLRRIRLSKDHLRKLPIIKFKKGDERYDVCAICLDDYEEGSKLRVLPCQHAFHCKCIDPWLTNNRRTCPICKRKVVPPGIPDSDDDSEDSADENTPLLAGSSSRSSPIPDESRWGAVGGHTGGGPEAVLDPPAQPPVSESYDSGIVNNAATDREDDRLLDVESSGQMYGNDDLRNLVVDLGDTANKSAAII